MEDALEEIIDIEVKHQKNQTLEFLRLVQNQLKITILIIHCAITYRWMSISDLWCVDFQRLEMYF